MTHPVADGFAILASLTEDQLVQAHAILIEKRRDGTATPEDDFLIRHMGKLISLSVQYPD